MIKFMIIVYFWEKIRNPNFMGTLKDSPQNLVTGRDPGISRGDLLSYAEGRMWVW